MTNDIQVFNFEQQEVRVVDRDGETWFVAKDVCDVLGLSNTSMVLEHLDDDERSKFYLGRQGEANIINESGLYAIIMRSNKPEARRFRKWVTGTVLPQIRRTGSFSVNQEEERQEFAEGKISTGIIRAARVILQTAGLKDNQLALALDKVYLHYTGDSLLEIAGIQLEAPAKKQLLTATEIGEQLEFLHPIKVNVLLESCGFQRKVGKKWEPTEKGKPFAVMVDTGKRHHSGAPVRQLLWDSSIIDEIKPFTLCDYGW